jgi:hypothetical protein
MTKTGNTNCRRCRGLLTTPASVARGYGARCWTLHRRETAARTAGYKPAAIAKAKELIADGGIVAIRGRRVFRAVSSDGTAAYLTAKEACSCPAGIKSRACYHRAAVTLIAA